MKKTLLFASIFMFVMAGLAVARMNVKIEKKTNSMLPVKIGILKSYAPFSWQNDKKEDFALIKDTVSVALFKNDYQAKYVTRKNVDDMLLDLEMGKIDVLLFNYFEEKLEKKFDYIYPAYFKNSLVLIMLPNNVKNVKNLDDLKKYNGVVRGDELFTSYVDEKIKAYKIKKAKNSFEAFDDLFSGEADYILTSKYSAMVEIMKYGLQNRVTISKQSLYQMPVFVVVSKLSQHRKKVVGALRKAFNEKSNYNKELVDILKDFEQKYKGAVPPKFSDAKTDKKDENKKVSENKNI